MAGSHGTLGVLTEVAFKVLPRPETTATLVLDGLDADTAGRAMRTAMATPCDVTGAAHAGGRTLLRVEGFEASVAHRAKVLAAALAPFGAAAVEAVDWAAIRDAAAFAGREGAVWRVSVRPSDGPVVGARLAGAEVIYDRAGGLLQVLAPEALDLRAALAGIGGHATLVRASDGGQGALGRLPPRAGAGRGDRRRAPGALRPAGHPEPGADGGDRRRLNSQGDGEQQEGDSDREAGAAAAGGGGVRVQDHEAGADQLLGEVDLGAGEERQRHRVDQHPRAVLLEHEVVVGGRVELDLVLEPRAAAALDGDAQRSVADLADAGEGAVGDARGDGEHGRGLWLLSANR